MNARAAVAVIVLLLGVVCGISGYNRMQPTAAEKVLGFAANLTGQQVPPELRRDRSDAYLLLGAGVALFATGVGMLVYKERAA